MCLLLINEYSYHGYEPRSKILGIIPSASRDNPTSSQMPPMVTFRLFRVLRSWDTPPCFAQEIVPFALPIVSDCQIPIRFDSGIVSNPDVSGLDSSSNKFQCASLLKLGTHYD